MVQELVIGRTTGGGTLETLRIEVNTCESQVICPSNKRDQSDRVSAIACGHIGAEVHSGGSMM